MLVTAQSAAGAPGERGCVATATSPDLDRWTVEPPLAEQVGLNQMEVLQVEEVDGRHVLVFCLCSADVRAPGLPAVTGTWTAPADSPTGPFHFDRAEPIDVAANYAGRIVCDRAGRWNLMAFVDVTADGTFGGCLGNPVPLQMTPRGTLQPAMVDATAWFRGELG